MRVKDVVLISVVCVLTSATFFGVGFITGDGRSLSGNDKLNYQMASLAGTWFGGLGTIVAVGAALYIAYGQARSAETLINHQHRMEKNDSALGALYHALAVVDDLRGRVAHLKNKACNVGAYPLAGYTLTMEGILTRYEMLFDRELYRYLTGPIIDQIKEMSGSFTGLNLTISLIATHHRNDPSSQVTMRTPQPSTHFDQLFKELDDLFTSIEQLATNEQLLKRQLQKS